MTRRVFRYDKPEKEVLLDVLNYANRTRFEEKQLSFTNVTPTDQLTGTRVTIVPETWTGWTSSEDFYYDRLDMATTFSKCPLVVDVSDPTKESILAALYDQRGIVFDEDKFDLSGGKQSLFSAFPNKDLNSLEPPIPNQEYPDQVPVPDNTTFVLTARSDSLLWIGAANVLVRPAGFLLGYPVSKRLELHQWFHETLSDKVAVELAIPRTLDATEHSAVLSRMVVGEHINETSLLPGIARSLTGDEWVSISDETVDFNLFNAKVVYNGFNRDEFYTGAAKLSRVIAVELSDSCRNLEGVWLIGYNDKEAFLSCLPRLAYDHTLLSDR